MTRREEALEIIKSILISGVKVTADFVVDYASDVINNLDRKFPNFDDKDELEESEKLIDQALKAAREKRCNFVGTFSIDNLNEALEKVKKDNNSSKTIDLEVLTAKTTQVPLSVINKTLKKGE